MKATIVKNPRALLPFQKPASRIRLKEGTIGSRLRGQLERRGFDVTEVDALNPGTLSRGSVVVQDDVILSDRFLDAFLTAIPDRSANHRCEIDVSRYPLLTPQDTGRSYRPIPVTFYGDPSRREIALLRMTPTPLHEADDGLPGRMHSLTKIRVYFLDFYGIDVTYWFDLQTASSLYCRERVANTVRLLRMFLPAFLVTWLLASRFLMERSSTIGKNCRIHPTAILEGCVVGDNVQIGAHAILRASVIADDVVVQERSSIKGAFLGQGAFVMGTAVVNSYVGAEASLVCPMLFHVVFGERAFISGGSGFADFIVGGGSIKVSIDGREIASNLSFLGSAVGDDCFLGANLIFAPGRTIPDGTRILDHGLIKAVPATAGGSFVMSGATLLQIPESFLGAAEGVMTGALPKEMQAWVVREERHGDPVKAMQLETVPVPQPRVGEVVVKVKAAGVNYNHIWACRGDPCTIKALHPDDPVHIGGSDASGIVAALGEGVRGWKPGDEVVTHPNQSCGQCGACSGFEPLGCLEQKAWGFETSFGSFGQYARVQARQLLRRPKNLDWAEASCYGLKLFTAYRMLTGYSSIKPNDRVLIWGASGGLGSYAIQLCRAVSAIPICVVSSPEKEAYCRSLGAELFIDRSDFPYLNDAEPVVAPHEPMRKFRRRLREVTGGYDPDVVFEHVGGATFPTSVFVARRMGKIVICGATTGHRLSFDARYLWMHQKQIVGSHGCNSHDAGRANFLIESGVVKPTLTRTYGFDQGAVAHQDLLAGDRCTGSLAILVP